MERCTGCILLVITAFFCLLHPGSPAEDTTLLNCESGSEISTLRQQILALRRRFSQTFPWWSFSRCSLWPLQPQRPDTFHMETSLRRSVRSSPDRGNACKRLTGTQREEVQLHLCSSVSVARQQALLSSTGAFPVHQQPENGRFSSPAEVFQKIQRQKRDAKATGRELLFCLVSPKAEMIPAKLGRKKISFTARLAASRLETSVRCIRCSCWLIPPVNAFMCVGVVFLESEVIGCEGTCVLCSDSSGADGSAGWRLLDTAAAPMSTQ